jgi:hypothetical protein
MPPRGAGTGGQNPEFVLQQFKGMNNVDARELIEDDEFYWCENAIPIGSGTLYPVPSGFLMGGSIAEVGPPKYTMMYTDGTANYVFAVFSSGNGYICKISGSGGTFTSTLILAGLVAPSAIPFNSGVLIIDQTGYWDYSVTTLNTLTPQNGTLAFATLTGTSSLVPIGASLRQNFAPATGSGGTYRNNYQVVSLVLNAAGTGYAVGDQINLADNSPTTAAQVIVATIGAGGAVATFTIATGGSWPGPTSITPIAVGPSGTVTTTSGGGTGATFTGNMQAFSTTIVTLGHGYPLSTSGVDQIFRGGVWVPITFDTVTSSGVISGSSIASYAGRVWIAFGKVVFFTDINSYNGFGGVGGSFTINDAYLIGAITALFSANNYLYIFGQTSIDALSNVTVTLGVTAFSRINLTASVGTIFATSIFSYLRAVVFYNQAGIWSLSGATPEKISQKIAGIIQGASMLGGAQVYGAPVMFRGELCAALQLTFIDTITGLGARPVIVMYFRGRWWVHTIPFVAPYSYSTAMASIPGTIGSTEYGLTNLYVWRGGATAATLYLALQPAPLTPLATWILKTKLWDGGAPLKEKQSLNAAIAGVFSGTLGSGVTCTIDTERVSSAPLNLIPNGEPTGYNLDVIAANEGGSQFLGMTITGGVEMTQIDLIALKGKADRDMLS